MTDGQRWLIEPETETVPAPVIPHYENPKNDNERLLEYQYRFLQGDAKSLGGLYNLAAEVCGKFISAISKKNRYVKAMPLDERREKAHDAACYVIEQYQTKPGWMIQKNFPGSLYLRVLKELFDRTKAEKIVDFVDLEDFKNLASPEEELKDDKFSVTIWFTAGDGKVREYRQNLLFDLNQDRR